VQAGRRAGTRIANSDDYVLTVTDDRYYTYNRPIIGLLLLSLFAGSDSAVVRFVARRTCIPSSLPNCVNYDMTLDPCKSYATIWWNWRNNVKAFNRTRKESCKKFLRIGDLYSHTA